MTLEYIKDIKVLSQEVKLINTRMTKVETHCKSAAHNILNEGLDQNTQRLN